MKPKFICKVEKTHLPTAFPVYYFGMPDDRVYLIYSRLYDTPGGETRIEYVFAVLEEYSYNYETGTLVDRSDLSSFQPESVFSGYNQKMVEIKVMKAFTMESKTTFAPLIKIAPELSKAVTEYHRKLEFEEQLLKEKEQAKHIKPV